MLLDRSLCDASYKCLLNIILSVVYDSVPSFWLCIESISHIMTVNALWTRVCRSFLGDGFMGVERTGVLVGFSECLIQTVNYTQITCLTSSGAVWSGDVMVSVMSTSNEVMAAVCEGDCVYSYSMESTPILKSLTPQKVWIQQFYP